MRLAIVGSRTFRNRQLMLDHLGRFLADHPVTALLSGGAPGADSLAEELARELALPCVVLAADWARHGRAAGPIRNAALARAADAVLAFVDKPLTESRGTRDVVQRFARLGKPVEVVEDLASC